MSVGEWEFQKLRTAAELDARPLALPPETAQKWCNFILFVPGRLPDDCVLRNGSVRREAPAGRVGGHTAGRTPWSENNPSAYRYEVVGAGRRLRIKQFLYDWAFPALGHPSLWKSSTRATPIDEQHVLWFGTDYMGNTGASARIGRTMVELSVLEGEFNDDDILGLYRSLDPADEGAASAIADTRFSALSYWARRPESPVISVPLGLWRIRQSGLIRMSWLADGEADKLGACTGAPSAGFAVSASTSYEHPFGHARRFSTLDHLTKGRIGWNIVTSYLPNAARNFSCDRMIPHDERYDRADEYLDVCYKLWEASWEGDAVLVDQARQIYADPAKVHEIDHVGEYFSVRGPHLAEPSPQRTPVLYQAGSSARGRAFAARHAECIFLSGVVPETLRRNVIDIRCQAAEFGRDPDDVKMLTSLSIVVAETEQEVRRKIDEFERLQRVEGMLAQYCGSTGFDLSRYARDEPVTYQATDHGQGAAALFTKDMPRTQTAGQIIDSMSKLGQTTLFVAGTPERVADQIESWVDDIGIDGFNLTQFISPGSFADFIELVVPELQRRGRYRTEYLTGTFREQLFGKGANLLPEEHPGGQFRTGKA